MPSGDREQWKLCRQCHHPCQLRVWYGGYYNALNVANEIGGKDPLKTLRWSAPLSDIIVGILYIMCTISWFAAVPLEKIKTSGTLVSFRCVLRPFQD